MHQSSENTINYINTGLMLLSLLLAMLVPFELFLFSFMILGPLHYLTEVSWLQKRAFFTKKSWEGYILIFLCFAMSILVILKFEKANEIITSLICIGFIFALIIQIVNQPVTKILLISGVVLLILFTRAYELVWFMMVFGIFMTTVIHTTIFTGIFILSGIRKNRSVSGIISFIIFAACSLFFYIIPLQLDFYKVSPYAKEAFGFFVIINKTISDVFHIGHFTKLDDVFYSREGLAIIRFVAFAYTYHYLNWFTKTSIIKWHLISKRRWAAIVVVWFSLVALYGYNVTIGLAVAYLFAMLHTVLEFPLNHQSFLALFDIKVAGNQERKN